MLTLLDLSQASYALYANASRQFRPRPLLDYLTVVFPLLVAVTSASSRPVAFSLALAIISGLLSWTVPRPRQASLLNGHGPIPSKKSKGKWLDESDSDEEPAAPASLQSPTNGVLVKLPSEVVPTASSTAVSPSTSPSLSPSENPLSSSRRRRHSPTPSTHNHTAIDVPSTPEPSGSSSLVNSSNTYPSPAGRGQTSTPNERFPFLSVYRAHMMIMTIHCILAVDFPIFPRSQGKCEDFGTSLVSPGNPAATKVKLMVLGRWTSVSALSSFRSVSSRSAPWPSKHHPTSCQQEFSRQLCRHLGRRHRCSRWE